MTDYQPYIISMPDAFDRQLRVREEFSRLGKEVSFVEAVNGKKLSQSELAKSYQRIERCDGRWLTLGEIGCFLSHRKCWKNFLSSDAEWALIGEDDIFCVHERVAEKILCSPDSIPSGVDILQIGAYKEVPENCRILKRKKKLVGDYFHDFDIVKMIDPISYGTQLYWINRKAAEYVLSKTERFTKPVDNYLFDQNSDVCKKLQIWTLCPFIAYQNEDPSFSSISLDRELSRAEAIPIEREEESFVKKLRRKVNRLFFQQKYIRTMRK